MSYLIRSASMNLCHLPFFSIIALFQLLLNANDDNNHSAYTILLSTVVNLLT